MIRTQIYIPDDLHTAVTVIAEAKNEPMAKVLRGYIRSGVKEERKKIKPVSLAALAKLNITEGPRDLSSNLDKYLYER